MRGQGSPCSRPSQTRLILLDTRNARSNALKAPATLSGRICLAVGKCSESRDRSDVKPTKRGADDRVCGEAEIVYAGICTMRQENGKLSTENVNIEREQERDGQLSLLSIPQRLLHTWMSPFTHSKRTPHTEPNMDIRPT